MKRTLVTAVLAATLPFLISAAPLSTNITSATVLIANFNTGGTFLGWGSGFFIDDGIVVTNKHVIKDGDWYRVYTIKDDNSVNLDCFQSVTRSNVKINLNDDVAYIRSFPPCDHGKILLAADPLEGDPISILGFPARGTIAESFQLHVSSGAVIGHTAEGWLSTDAPLDFGNSGGPVVNGTDVVGVAVAKSVDATGHYVAGFFIPSSVILAGLLYANDSHFGYTGPTTVSSRSSASSASSLAPQSSQRSDVGSSVSSQRSRPLASRSSQRSEVGSSASSVAPQESMSQSLKTRTCARVQQWFGSNPSTLARVNERLQKRFGFVCH